jgi:hypothetical protein
MTFVKLDFAKDRQDAELTKEIQNRITRINSYIQHPDAETLLPLLGEDLATRYGQERVFHMADGILWGGNDIDDELSQQFTDLFQTFNEHYFDGNLRATT